MLGASCVLLGLLPAQQKAAADYRVDLTQIEQDGAYRVTGVRVNSATKRVELPLEVTLQNVWPLSVVWRDRVEVDVLIKNIGEQPVSIPVSKRSSEVFRPGTTGRRVGYLLLKLTPIGNLPTSIKPITLGVGSAIGSPSVPHSLVELAPNESILFKTAGMLDDAVRWHEDGLSLLAVKAQAVYSVLYIADDELVSTNSSVEDVSENAIEFTIAWP